MIPLVYQRIFSNGYTSVTAGATWLIKGPAKYPAFLKVFTECFISGWVGLEHSNQLRIHSATRLLIKHT